MLITQSGFKAFNEHKLSATLDAQLSRLREEVKSLTKSGDTSGVSALAERYKFTPLAFNRQNLTIETTTADIPAEYFPGGFSVDSGKSYQKDVLVFHLPFIGDQSLLRCMPSTCILRTEEIAIQGNEIIFEIIKFTDDVDDMCKKRDGVVNFLTQQAENVNKQIEQYNNTINQVIADTETQTRSQISKHEEFLSQLGTPARKEKKPKKT